MLLHQHVQLCTCAVWYKCTVAAWEMLLFTWKFDWQWKILGPFSHSILCSIIYWEFRIKHFANAHLFQSDFTLDSDFNLLFIRNFCAVFWTLCVASNTNNGVFSPVCKYWASRVFWGSTFDCKWARWWRRQMIIWSKVIFRCMITWLFYIPTTVWSCFYIRTVW